MANDAQGLSTKKILTTKNPFIKEKSPEKSFDFLLRDTYWEVSEKFDGVKVYAWRKNQEWDDKNWSENWIFSYKGSILYPEEYEYLLSSEEAQDQVRKESKASSQYVFFLKHFKDTHQKGGFSDEVKSDTGTLYFMEYIMKKATLALEYDSNYKMFLIAYFPNVNPQVKGDGNIIFGVDEGSGEMKGREEKASGLGLDDKIVTIYEGNFANESAIASGIKSDALKESYSKVIVGNYDEAEDYQKVVLLNEMFLNTQSSIGGLSEGVVLVSDEADKAFAFNREREPVSKETKEKIGEIRNQNEEAVLRVIEKIMSDIKSEVEDFFNKEKVLKLVSTKLYSGDYDFLLDQMEYKEIGYGGSVEEASLFNKRDMVYLRFKMNYLSDVKYSSAQLALLPGKFRIVTNGHKRMMDKAAELSGSDENVIVALVGVQNTPKALRLKMIKSASPNSHVIEVKDANLKNIIDINKLKGKVKYIISGSDRETGYEKQVQLLNDQGYDLEYVEVQRPEGSESATETENMVKNNDFEGFKKATPYGSDTEYIFNQLKKTFKVEEALWESETTSVDTIKSLLDFDQKVYVLYGGIGSGKSYHVERNFPNVKVIDSDNIAMSGHKGDLKDIPNTVYSTAAKEKLKQVANALQGDQSFIEMGTSANKEAAIKKINKAKEMGFVTAFIFVDVPLQVSIDRNRSRIESGGRGVPQDLEYKIERTNERARETSNSLKSLVDYYIEVPYNKPIMESIRKTLKGVFFG